MIVKYNKFLIFLAIPLLLFLGLIPSSYATCCGNKCNLDIYVKDNHGNLMDADVYVNGVFKGHNSHIVVELDDGTYTVTAEKPDYDYDSEIVTCSCGDTKRVDLTLNRRYEENRLEAGDLDVTPDEICRYEYRGIELSIPVTLRSGHDNIKVTVRFYAEEDNGDWNFIGKDEKELDVDQTRTFEIDYYYNYDDLDEGSHDIKAVIEAEDIRINEFGSLDIKDCGREERPIVNVGSIELYPSNPDKGDVVQVKVPVTLESGDSERVYVYAYIDNDKFFTTNKFLNEDMTERFSFTFDTDDYSTGSHTIRVTAKVNTKTDSSTRSFTIGKTFAEKQTHCLSIDNIRTDKPIQPGITVKVLADVLSCGEADENEVKVKVEAFGKTYYTGFFDVVSGQTKEVFIPISVPEDVSGKQTIKVTAWNERTTDTFSKDFVVSTGIPFIEIKKEFIVETCKTEKITFTVVNTGDVSDVFTLKVTGPSAEWITGISGTVSLEPNERKTITAYAAIPCDTESGFYEFTITAEGSPNYSATSSIRVIKTWSWPMFALPTGFFWLAILSWIPLLLLILLIIFIIFLLLLLFSGRYNDRRRPMFECKNGCGC